MSSPSLKTPVVDPAPPPSRSISNLSLNEASLYLDRELSLLAFQRRVLEEAQDPANPLLERVKFISILFSNLDEFFMVRVAVLKQKAATNMLDGFVADQLEHIRADVKQLMADAYDTWRGIAASLDEAGIELRSYSQLSEKERTAMEAYFREVVYPVLTPLAFDLGPAVSAYLESWSSEPGRGWRPRDAKGVERFARVKVPDTLCPNWFRSTGRPAGGRF